MGSIYLKPQRNSILIRCIPATKKITLIVTEGRQDDVVSIDR